MEKYIKYLTYGVVFLIGVLLVWSVYTKEVGATSIHTEWKNKGDVEWSGVCKAETPACGEVSEGTEYGEQDQECKLLGGGGGFPCIVGQKRTIEVSRGCEVQGDVCEEPSCEETQTCEPEVVPEEPVVPEEKFTPKKPAYSQGPHGVKGDSKCQLEWKTIKGSKKVEVRYAEDGVFGNGYKSFTTKDDGAQWLNSDSGVFKLRGRDSKTDWSDAKKYSC